MLEKKLAKKNAELLEVRDFRKKLDDKEKEICSAIEKIQNQKIEIIFEQVKKEIRNKNLDISSASVLTIIDALKNNQQILQTEENFETDDESEEILPEEKADKFFSQLNSFATADEMSVAKWRRKKFLKIAAKSEKKLCDQIRQNDGQMINAKNHRDAVSRLDDDEKDEVGITDPIGRVQKTLIVNESGFYSLVFQSHLIK